MTTQLDPIEPKTARERELRDRAVRDYAALQAVGLDTTRTFFAPGTEATVAKERGTIKAKRRDFENSPAADDGLTALADLVLSEDRQDWPARLGGLSTDAGDARHVSTGLNGGLLVTKPWQRLAPTDVAWQQVASKRPPDHAAAAGDVSAWLFDVPQHDVVLRTRKLPANRGTLGADRECFAIVSPGYVAYDLDRAANDLKAAAPAGSRVKTRYDGARATVERVRCINLTLLHAKTSLMHGTHRQKNLQDLVGDALEQIAPTMEQFAATWRGAWAEYYADKHTGTISGEEAIKRIVAKGAYRIPGLGKEGTLAACLAALAEEPGDSAEEPGDSRAHVHNALTAAAHKAPVSWATRWSDTAAEEQASQLLYQKVLWLPEAEA